MATPHGHVDPSSTSPSPQAKEKSKARATAAGDVNPSPSPMGEERSPIVSAIEEALATPLGPPSTSTILESSFERASSPISPPPQAHRGMPAIRHFQPRLLSQLTRSFVPSPGLSYEASRKSGEEQSRAASYSGLPQSQGESSTAWQRASPTTALTEEPFPDLDPATGLPLEAQRRGSTSSTSPSLHLQRTITGLVSVPSRGSSIPTTSLIPKLFNLPKVSIPGTRSSVESQRGFSSSAEADDWGRWATGWWRGNKGRVDRLMSEEDQADTIEEEKAMHKRKYGTPKNPVVFCHGLLGFDILGPASLPPLQISHWRGIREVLENNGVEVLITRVPATASIADRAAILDEAISERYSGRDVNLIGHSMGGLDCRYLISSLKPKSFKPVSLTTISTPHRGSPFADYVIDNLIGRERLPSLLSLMETMRLPQSGDGSAFNALGTRSMREFNAEIVDREDVKYYSWGASFDPGLLDTFRWPHSVILAKEGPNDGLVSVTSAKWGEYRGTLLGVNHLDLVGWVNHVRYVLSGWTGNPIAFKPATFYLEVADYLAEQGF